MPFDCHRPGAQAPRRRGARLALLVGVALLAGPAHADLKLCNETASRVGVAIGYKDLASGEWVTEGWWNLLSHSCETLLPGVLQARFYYVHAVDYDRGGGWAGKDKMCTDKRSFTIRGVGNCAERKLEQAGFMEVDTGEANDYTIRLADPGDQEATAK